MAKKSLVSEHQTESTTIATVEIPDTDIQVAGPVSVTSPYVVFASVKSHHFGKWQMANPSLQDSDPVLVLPEPRPALRLNPFRFMLLKACQHFSEIDPNDGRVVRSRQIKSDDISLKEHVETVVLVLHDGKATPTRCTFKTTKVNAVHRAIDALKLAGNDVEWGNLSAAHKTTLAIKPAWGRFVATVVTKASTSRSTGYKYVAANALIHPSTPADWDLVAAFFNSPESKEQYAAVVSAHARRMEEIQQHLET